MTELFWQHWRPEHPRAVLINVHGLGDHSGMYPEHRRVVPARAAWPSTPSTRGATAARRDGADTSTAGRPTATTFTASSGWCASARA